MDTLDRVRRREKMPAQNIGEWDKGGRNGGSGTEFTRLIRYSCPGGGGLAAGQGEVGHRSTGCQRKKWSKVRCLVSTSVSREVGPGIGSI